MSVDVRIEDAAPGGETPSGGKQMTWESECRHTLRFLNPDGDLGICVLWNLLESVMEQLPEDAAGSRLYAVGNSRTPIGISWLLRGLLLNPQVRTLAIWGADLTKTGEALLQLWAEGPTPDHRVPVFNWKLDALISPELIDRLRSEVRLVDGRGRKLPEVVAELNGRPAPAPVHREPIELPPVVVPDRVTLPSRGSTVTVHARDVGEGWLQAINAVLRLGEVRRSRKKETIAHTFHVTVELPVPAEPIAVPECFDVTPADFETYFEHFSSPTKADGVDYGYGERMQSWRGHNQLREVVARLKAAPDTKRATISLLDATDLEELEDAPCLVTVTFAIANGELLGSYVYRSHDMYQGWPLNVLALLRLHQAVAAELAVKSGRATFVSQNAQIYERHWSAAEEKLRRFFKRKPGIRLDPAGSFVFTIEDGVVKAKLTSVAGDEVLWETEGRNPEALIRDLVHQMPWLEAGHVLYLGQEAEKLSRAIRGQETYRQG